MSENPNRVSRRNIIKGLAATGIGVGVLGSSSRLSPTRTVEASSDEVEYASNFGDKHEFRHENSDDSDENHDGSLGVQAGVVQTRIGKEEVGDCYIWEHYVTVWAIAPFIRIFDNDEDGVYRSGVAMDKQTTDISTYADTSCVSNAPLDLKGSRFASITGGENPYCAEAGSDYPSYTANYYNNDETYEHKDYDGYSDVKYWSEEYGKESESDSDDFNSWDAAVGAFGGVVGLVGATAGGPLGAASLATAGPSFFQLFSELATANSATLDGDNQEISFSDSDNECGLMANLIEFRIVADAEEKFEVSVESEFDVRDETVCYGTKLDSNVDSRTCFNINVPWNSADTDVEDAQRINTTECGEH